MTRKKHIFTILIAVFLVFSMAACGQNNNDQPAGSTGGTTASGGSDSGSSFDPMAKYSPAITLSTAISVGDEMQTYIGIKSDVLENNNWISAYKDRLGINVTYDWSVPSTQYEQKVNAIIIANDLPDIISVSSSQLRLLVENGMAADLTDVFAQYATDFTNQMMDEDDHMGLSQATFNGKLMAIPAVNGNTDGSNMLWIRKDWMDALGKTAPKTIDELFELAEAFKEADLDKTGQAYGIGVNSSSPQSFLGGGWGELTGFIEGFGNNPNGWVDVNGKAAYGRVQPSTRDAIEKLAEMYKKGVLHKEFATRDLTEDLASGRVGIMYGQHWNSFWPLQMTIDNNPEADWLPFPLPTVDGSPVKSMLGGSAGEFYVVSPDFAHPEAAVKLLNFNYAVDCALSPDFDGDNFHIPGNMVQEKPEAAFQWSIVKGFYPKQNLFIHRGVMQYVGGDESIMSNPWVVDNINAMNWYLEDPVGGASNWGAYRWSGPEGAFSVIDYYQVNNLILYNLFFDTTDGMVEYNTTLNDLATTTLTKIIMGVEPIDSFDTFVEQWFSLGGTRITEEVNQILGR